MTKPMVTRHDVRYFPIEIMSSSGQIVLLSWAEAARVYTELGQELQDHDLEVQEQRELEARAADMIATTATLPTVPAS